MGSKSTLCCLRSKRSGGWLLRGGRRQLATASSKRSLQMRSIASEGEQTPFAHCHRQCTTCTIAKQFAVALFSSVPFVPFTLGATARSQRLLCNTMSHSKCCGFFLQKKKCEWRSHSHSLKANLLAFYFPFIRYNRKGKYVFKNKLVFGFFSNLKLLAIP